MSMWTHVAGCIRIDAIRLDDEIFDQYVNYIKKRLGTIETYLDEHQEGNPLPRGSEGSLEYNILINPKKNDMAAIVVTVWGDLRDFYESDVPKIETWFNNLISDEEIWIRGAILGIYVENGFTKTLTQ